MSLSDPIITANCDDCGDSEELTLTSLAGGGWDARSVPSQLKRLRWTAGDGDLHYCDECSARRYTEGKTGG